MNITRIPIPTRDGDFLASYSEQGLCGLDFPTTKRGAVRPAAPSAELRRWHAATRRAVLAVLSGKPVPELPPMDLSTGTAFQRAVWEVLRSIPGGKTLSYGEVARRIGKGKAARAVGAACGANPIPLLVPCHRVLASGGALGGFSAGLDWKRKMLAREGVEL